MCWGNELGKLSRVRHERTAQEIFDDAVVPEGTLRDYREQHGVAIGYLFDRTDGEEDGQLVTTSRIIRKATIIVTETGDVYVLEDTGSEQETAPAAYGRAVQRDLDTREPKFSDYTRPRLVGSPA